MRIAFCHHLDLDFGSGGEKFVINMANELSRIGHDVSVFSVPFTIEGRRAVKDAHNLLDDEIYFERSYRHKVEADVAYVTYDPYTPINRAMFDLTKSKVKIAGVHSSSFWEPISLMYGKIPNIGRLGEILFGKLEASRYDAIHAVTDCCPIKHKRFYHIPNFVDSTFFQPKANKLGKFTVTYANRKSLAKGWDLFNEASNYFDGDIDLSVSDGTLAESKMPTLFSSAHLTVAPSRVDTFGYSIIESLLCETPVLTTPLAAHKSLGVPLFYVGNSQQIAQKVNFLKNLWLDEAERYRQICILGRRQALKFDKALILGKFESMLNEVFQKCRF